MLAYSVFKGIMQMHIIIKLVQLCVLYSGSKPGYTNLDFIIITTSMICSHSPIT